MPVLDGSLLVTLLTAVSDNVQLTQETSTERAMLDQSPLLLYH